MNKKIKEKRGITTSRTCALTVSASDAKSGHVMPLQQIMLEIPNKVQL